LIFDLLMLVGLPVVVYAVARAILPNYALPLLILAVMPTGMAAPLLADIVGGRESLAMALTFTTSLLAPFTVPIMIRVLAGVSVTVDFWQMFLSIAEIIFIPFLLAWLVRRFVFKNIVELRGGLGRLSTVFLGLLVAGIVAEQSPVLLASFAPGEVFWSLVVVSVLMAFFYLLGYVLYTSQIGRDRLTLTVSFANMNFTLAIFLAHKYFPVPEVVIPITLAVIPWFVFIVFFKYLTQKVVKPA